MKHILYLLSIPVISVGLLTSCSLDSEDIVEKASNNFPTTEDDAAQMLQSVYQNLNQATGTPQATFYYVSMLASDDNLGGGGVNDKRMQAEDLLCNYNTDMTRQFWDDRYVGIYRANDLIKNFADGKLSSLSETDAKQIEGEARFLRAFYYYELASQYGNIPLKLIPDNEVMPQAKPAEVWGQILYDLKWACDNMPSVKTTDARAGHVDKYAAEAMLGRAFLFYTGMYCNGDDLAALTSTNYNPLSSVTLPDGSTLTKQQVASYIDDCVNNSGYSLVSDYRNLWAYSNRCTARDYQYDIDNNLKWVEDDGAVNPETLFSIKYNKLASWSTTIGYCNDFALHFGVRGGQDYANTFPFGQGWGAGPVAANLVQEWQSTEPNDLRLSASIVKTSDMPNYKKGGWDDFVQETDYYQKKQGPITSYKDKTANTLYCTFENEMYGSDSWAAGAENMQLGSIHDLVLIRFADVLLMQSELEEDVSGINRVRARAGLEPIATYSLQALQNERRHELAFEGTRWNDIRRWHIAAAALEEQTNTPTYFRGISDSNTPHNGGYAARYNATAGFFKIPESEISLSNGLLVQNPGWDSDAEYNGWQ
ncbi:MAG: RagB/SusD family nutrient uptake outer membrane protein [Prevotella sp.]|jgi:hypothetical protein